MTDVMMPEILMDLARMVETCTCNKTYRAPLQALPILNVLFVFPLFCTQVNMTQNLDYRTHILSL